MSLANTVMQNIRENSAYDKWEERPSRYGALDLFMMDTENPMGIISPNLRQSAVSSIGRTLQIPVINYDSGVSIGSSLSVTVADDENTSTLYSVTFTPYSFGFTMTPSAYLNNEIDYMRDFERKMVKYIHKFAATLDTACVTALESAKTQVFGTTLDYSTASNVLVAPLAKQEEIVGDIGPLMAANDYYDRMHIVGNPGAESVAMKLSELGLYNERDKRIQFNNKDFHFSNRVTNGAGHKATMFVVNEGSTGYLHRFEREALAARVMEDGTRWDIDTLPILNFPVGTYFYESKGDYNAIAGAATADMTRAYKEHYGFAVYVAFLTAYNSDQTTIASPIMKVAVASS